MANEQRGGSGTPGNNPQNKGSQQPQNTQNATPKPQGGSSGSSNPGNMNKDRDKSSDPNHKGGQR